ncbi:hypothetical protein ELZ25_27155 [Salmonella enterica]|nr:hypothetical protein [Salmonella enterica]
MLRRIASSPFALREPLRPDSTSCAIPENPSRPAAAASSFSASCSALIPCMNISTPLLRCAMTRSTATDGMSSFAPACISMSALSVVVLCILYLFFSVAAHNVGGSPCC